MHFLSNAFDPCAYRRRNAVSVCPPPTLRSFATSTCCRPDWSARTAQQAGEPPAGDGACVRQRVICQASLWEAAPPAPELHWRWRHTTYRQLVASGAVPPCFIPNCPTDWWTTDPTPRGAVRLRSGTILTAMAGEVIPLNALRPCGGSDVLIEDAGYTAPKQRGFGGGVS